MESNKQAEYDRKDRERLDKLITKVTKLVSSHSKILLTQCNEVGSFQFQKIRKLLRGEAEIVRGKVAHLRTSIQHQLLTHPELKPLLQHIKGEIGLFFTNMDIWYIKNKIEAQTSQCKAKLNSRTPVDIFIPEGQSDLTPTQAGFFGALNIPIKIMNGKIYFTKESLLFQKGDLITTSVHQVLCFLGLKPITKRVTISHAYFIGTIIDEKILGEAPHLLEKSLLSGIQNIASISVAIGAANKSSMMYVLKSGLRNVQAVAIGLTMESTSDLTEK